MASYPEPNRIHTLPVQIQYHLPYSSHSFTTILPSPQQVYVCPAAPSDKGGDAESWGSIYLKTVVQGVVMASPEIHPSGADVPDLSLYIFDPRETYLRKSRPSHLRPSHPSSPAPGSPNLASTADSPHQAVWTGKGLVSWALSEAGVGKNLITGRLVRSSEFTRVLRSSEMDPLEALVAMGLGGETLEESWGIEVSLGLKHATGGSFGYTPHVQQAHAISRHSSPQVPVVSPAATPSSSTTHQFQRPTHPQVPRQKITAPSARQPVAGPSAPTPQRRLPNSTPAQRPEPLSRVKTGPAPAASKKRRPIPPTRHLTTVDTNSRNRRGSVGKPTGSSAATASAMLPFEIPRDVYNNPDLLTKEQAERLIASPLFLDKISQMTGHPLVPKIKREREDDTTNLGSGKKPRFSRTDADGESKSMCYNCGRVQSFVWRQMTLDGGEVVTVCNACGLYKNRHGQMRPPSMWEGVDDDVKSLRMGTQPPMPASEGDMPATRLDSGFKRTMSAVVDKDANRIASLRKPPTIPRPTQLNKSFTRAAPATSPPRGSASASAGVRNASRSVNTQPAASSPGGVTMPASDAQPGPRREREDHSQSIAFDPNESPNTAIRRILGTNMPLQSLDMPLSPDRRGGADDTVDWSTTDISSYFEVGQFEMSAGPHGATALKSPSPPPPLHRTSSSAASKRRAYTHHHPSESNEEDDVLSQLFNRTSSIGPLESSPAPFDFSQLPPSSPPASSVGPSSDIDLGHSVLLLSSPNSASPVFPLAHRVSPDKKSGLKHSFTPQQQSEGEENQPPTASTDKVDQAPPQYRFDELDWSNIPGLGVSGATVVSSGEAAEGLLGGQMGVTDTDDFMALFNSLTNAQ